MSDCSSAEGEFLAALKKTRTTDDVRHVEAQAAQLWWRQWTGFELTFKGPVPPAVWRTFQSRYIGRPQGKLGELAMQFAARNAVHPMQATQNYAVAVLVSRIARVVIVKGLDPCFGFLHDGRKPGRMSLCWDFAELWRPKLARAVFEFAKTRTFRKDDFAVFEHGIVRLSAPIARDIATLTIKALGIREITAGLSEIIELFP